jgi:glycosyltransferase involved in cell wall biosynthesis
MKKILFLIHNMQLGGAQKSLISFLNCLEKMNMADQYELHLMPIDPTGSFMEQVPQCVRVVQPPVELRWLGTKLSAQLIMQHFSIRALMGEIRWKWKKLCKNHKDGLNLQQRLWACWRDTVPCLKEEYDVAISYMDGVPNYYVMDKVNAGKKILWFHSEYRKQGYDPEFDTDYFRNCHGLITISQNCRSCLVREFQSMESKIHVLENISSADDVIHRSSVPADTEFDAVSGWKLLSVGRLNPEKGFDLAIETAAVLNKSGLEFLWLIVGEGAQRSALQEKIDGLGLQNRIRLIGARDNPYVYMARCDILVQPSRWEGKSIVLDEAKILSKCIVSTNYTTVFDSLEHGRTGWVVDMTPDAMAEGILKLCADDKLRQSLCDCLRNQPKGNEEQLRRYIELMF